jgi:transposase
VLYLVIAIGALVLVIAGCVCCWCCCCKARRRRLGANKSAAAGQLTLQLLQPQQLAWEGERDEEFTARPGRGRSRNAAGLDGSINSESGGSRNTRRYKPAPIDV